MSRSIKQYKAAMDKIKASESFMSRTEDMLKDAVRNESKIVINQPKRWTVKNISLSAGAGLAACIIAIIALRSNLVSDTDSISTVEVTSVTEVTETGTEPVFLDIQDDSQMEALKENMPETTPSAAEEAPLPADDKEAETSAAPATEKPVRTESTAGAPNNTSAAALAPSDKDNAAAQAESERTEGESRPLNHQYSSPTDEDVLCEDASEEGAAAVGSDNTDYIDDPLISSLYSLDYTVCAVDIQSCTKDGEPENLRLSDYEAQNMVSNIANVIYNSITFNPGSGFVSEFVINISDISSSEDIFTIYLTDNQFVVITEHLPEQQKRTTYLLKRADYEALEKMMYLNFGSESDFEAYLALKSGK